MALRTRLKHILLDKNMTATELAELIGADRTQVSKWANGKPPGLERAIQIAEVLGVPVEEIWQRVK